LSTITYLFIIARIVKPLCLQDLENYNMISKMQCSISPPLTQIFLSCTILLVQSSFYYNPNSFAEAFRYRLKHQEIIAPERLCFSGDATSENNWSISSGGASQTSYTCPTTPEDAQSYPAVIMDQDGYVKIHIKDVRLRDDGRRRNGFHQSSENGSFYWSDRKHHARMLEVSNNNSEENAQKDEMPGETDNSESLDGNHENANKEVKIEEEEEVEEESQGIPHHLQVFMVPLDIYSPHVLKSQCCYELETSPPDWIEKTPEGKVILPKECKYNPSTKLHTNIENEEDSLIAAFSHDYRVNAARIRPLGFTSAPVELNAPETASGIEVMTTLRPDKPGRYMVVVSNCAAELSYDHERKVAVAKGLKMILTGMDITFVSKFGELPLSMMGIIPFYGLLMISYSLLSLLWWHQSSLRKRHYKPKPTSQKTWWKLRSTFDTSEASTPMTLLGLQNAIKILVFGQTAFSALAFSYYLYLNGTSVDVNVLYSGTAAALVNYGPWSIAVALAHFGTLLGCQTVVTLATDGTWLIQSSIQPHTKKALMIMICIWGFYFISYGFLSLVQRRILYLIFGIGWIVFLIGNVRRSLRHLKSLLLGQSTDQIIAVGGAIVAKRSMYRKILVAVGVYPVIFAGSFLWTLVSFSLSHIVWLVFKHVSHHNMNELNTL